MATSEGLLSTGITATTVLPAVAITIRHIGEFPIAGDGHAKRGIPTGIVATTVLLAVAITETVLDWAFVT